MRGEQLTVKCGLVTDFSTKRLESGSNIKLKLFVREEHSWLIEGVGQGLGVKVGSCESGDLTWVLDFDLELLKLTCVEIIVAVKTDLHRVNTWVIRSGTFIIYLIRANLD